MANAADNGTLITLGLVGVVAVAGAFAKRGSMARMNRGRPLDWSAHAHGMREPIGHGYGYPEKLTCSVCGGRYISHDGRLPNHGPKGSDDLCSGSGEKPASSAGSMARSTGRSVLLVSRMDDPYEGVRPGWYITNTESGVQVAGPFRTEASARQRLSSLEGHVGAAAKRGSLSKGETFAVGDRIKHRREFLRSIAWYTGVPRYGTVRAVTSLGKRALLEVDWSDGHTSKIISPNVTHASRVELV